MTMMQLLTRVFQGMLVLGALGLLLATWNKDLFPEPGFYDQQILQEPLQQPSDREPFQVEAGDQRYQINPLYEYQLHGVVVSLHDTDAWWDIYHREWEDYLNVRDLCVVWGANVTSGVYRDMEFKNTAWTCWASWYDARAGDRFVGSQLSNNHLLVNESRVHRQLMQADVGDQVYLRGVLAEYANLDNGARRGTSTVRTDTGNGACETVFVDDFRVLQRANSGWRKLYGFALVTTLLALAGLTLVFLFAPARPIGS